MILHLVLFNPKKDIPGPRKHEFLSALEDTCRQISSVRRATIGRKIEISAGYDRTFGEKTYQYVASLEFANEAGLVEYLRHPLHEKLGRLFWELCESTIVLECMVTDAKTQNLSNILGLDQNIS